MATEDTAVHTEDSSASEVRTAAVIVHGMGEKHPMETLDGFAKTALRPRSAQGDKKWDYYSLPAEITDSYEARHFKGPGDAPTEPVRGHAEIYEYHWSFLMTANKFAGAMPMTLRLLLRRPSNVPDALLGIWRSVWTVVLGILLAPYSSDC